MPTVREKYIAELGRRAKESHIYRNYQLTGLEIADILGDRPHKALYIKMAKDGNPRRLLAIAKDAKLSLAGEYLFAAHETHLTRCHDDTIVAQYFFLKLFQGYFLIFRYGTFAKGRMWISCFCTHRPKNTKKEGNGMFQTSRGFH